MNRNLCSFIDFFTFVNRQKTKKFKKKGKIRKNLKENAKKKGLESSKRYRSDSRVCSKQSKFKKDEKNLKKFKKLLKKVLTNGNIYDILHERSTEGRKKQRSLKIEQQQIRTN